MMTDGEMDELEDRNARESLRFFSASEFVNFENMDVDLLERLDHLRFLFQMPIHITSSWRDADPGDRPSAHHFGWAVDIRVDNSLDRMTLVREAISSGGFTRIGIYDKHIHLDVADQYDDATFPQGVMWTGVSK